MTAVVLKTKRKDSQGMYTGVYTWMLNYPGSVNYFNITNLFKLSFNFAIFLVKDTAKESPSGKENQYFRGPLIFFI